MKTAGLKRFAVGLLLAAIPLLAEEAAGAAEKPSMELWKWLNFAILAGILGYIAVKQGGPAFSARSKDITEGLAAGERAKSEADRRAAEVSAKLANLESEIAKLRTQAREEREREADRIRKGTASEIGRLQHQVSSEIESAGKQARLELQRYAAQMALDLAEKKVRARMSPAVEATLLDRFVGGFK